MVPSASCYATVSDAVRHLCCCRLCLSAQLHCLPFPCLPACHCSAPDGLAHNCSVCWNATTKTQFWGFVNAVINLQSLVNGQDSRLRDLRVMVRTRAWVLGGLVAKTVLCLDSKLGISVIQSELGAARGWIVAAGSFGHYCGLEGMSGLP